MKRLAVLLVTLVALTSIAAPVEAANVSTSSHHHSHYSSRRAYGYGYGYGSPYRYGGYGYMNSGFPGNSFANPAAFGFGPGAIFGW